MACDQYKKLSHEEKNKKREYSKLDIGICLTRICKNYKRQYRQNISEDDKQKSKNI